MLQQPAPHGAGETGEDDTQVVNTAVALSVMPEAAEDVEPPQQQRVMQQEQRAGHEGEEQRLLVHCHSTRCAVNGQVMVVTDQREAHVIMRGRAGLVWCPHLGRRT